MKLIIFELLLIFCINLSHAQTIAIPKIPSVNLKDAVTKPNENSTNSQSFPQVSPPPPSTTTSPTNSGSAPSVGSGPEVNPATPKYDEYQSICRTHEFDQVQYLSDNLKDKRIQLLVDKTKQESDNIKLKVRLVKEYAEQKKIKDAEVILKEIRNLKTNQTDVQLAEAYFEFGKMNRKNARDILNKIIAEQPKHVESLKLLAEVYKTELNYFEYTAIYEDLKKITKENYDEQLCEALTLDAHYSDAEKYCLNGLKGDKSATSAIYLGIAQREKDNLKEAQNYFSKAIKIKESEMAHVCNGEIYFMEKKYEQAAESYKLAITLNPKSLRAHLALAWAYFNAKDRTLALNSFQAACLLNKSAAVELRQAIKILILEKSDLTKQYSVQNEKCGSI